MKVAEQEIVEDVVLHAQMIPLVRVEGRVVTADNEQPVAGLEIALKLDTTMVGGPPLEKTSVTGADGRFDMANLPAGGPLALWTGEQFTTALIQTE